MPRVLVADDTAALRLVVRITVESQGWAVIEAATGQEALRQACGVHPDLVLLDLDFGDPSLNGIEVCRQIRRTPETSTIPVIVLTASDRPVDRSDAAAAGADLFMMKPFGPIELLGAMRSALHQYLAGAGLGLYLLDAGVLPAGELQEALVRQRALAAEGRRIQLGELLVETGAITPAELSAALERQRTELGLRQD